MAKVEIYTKSWCGYSKAALRLLDRKGISYTHIDVTDDPDQELIMNRRANAHTVPQLFINGRSIGGYDDLAALEKSGELDRLLALEPTGAPIKKQDRGYQDEQTLST